MIEKRRFRVYRAQVVLWVEDLLPATQSPAAKMVQSLVVACCFRRCVCVLGVAGSGVEKRTPHHWFDFAWFWCGSGLRGLKYRGLKSYLYYHYYYYLFFGGSSLL